MSKATHILLKLRSLFVGSKQALEALGIPKKIILKASSQIKKQS